MTLLQALILGILQGFSEFLPISSSGHLVLLPNLLGWELPPNQAFAFNVMLQAATLVAVLSYFIKDITSLFKSGISAVKNKSFKDPQAKMVIYLVITTIPAGLVGISLNGLFEKLFNNPMISSILLLGTAGLLIIAEKAGKRNRTLDDITWIDALWIGIFQIFALLPGISRSGVTITGGMVLNFKRTDSARYSFLVSIPILIAAGANGFYKFLILPDTTSSLPIFLVGTISAAITGYIAIKWLLGFLKRRSFYAFAVYCTLFAILNLVVISIRSS